MPRWSRVSSRRCRSEIISSDSVSFAFSPFAPGSASSAAQSRFSLRCRCEQNAGTHGSSQWDQYASGHRRTMPVREVRTIIRRWRVSAYSRPARMAGQSWEAMAVYEYSCSGRVVVARPRNWYELSRVPLIHDRKAARELPPTPTGSSSSPRVTSRCPGSPWPRLKAFSKLPISSAGLRNPSWLRTSGVQHRWMHLTMAMTPGRAHSTCGANACETAGPWSSGRSRFFT